MSKLFFCVWNSMFESYVRLVCGMDCEVCELDGKLELAVTRLNIELCCLNA